MSAQRYIGGLQGEFGASTGVEIVARMLCTVCRWSEREGAVIVRWVRRDGISGDELEKFVALKGRPAAEWRDDARREA